MKGTRKVLTLVVLVIWCLWALVPLASSYLSTIDPTELVLVGQDRVVAGKQASFRVYVSDGARAEAASGMEVDFALRSARGKLLLRLQGRTGGDGTVVFRPKIPQRLKSRFSVEVQTRGSLGRNKLSRSFALHRPHRIYLTTDKPMYKPGQRILIRTLSMDALQLKPLQGRMLLLEILDGKGNKVFKKQLKTSRFGIAATDFELASQVNLGSYEVQASLDGVRTTRKVKVAHYVLPRYKIQVKANKPYYQPGERVSYEVKARYTFGKPVAGAKVRVLLRDRLRGAAVIRPMVGKTDGKGRFIGSFGLPRHLGFAVGRSRIRLEVEVVDKAGEKRKKHSGLILTRSPILIHAIPESGGLVGLGSQRLFVVTTYPDGRPAQTDLRIEGLGIKARTSALGVAQITWPRRKVRSKIAVVARDGEGRVARARIKLKWASSRFFIRADASVYRPGARVKLQVFSGRHRDRIFLDVVKEGQTLSTHVVAIKKGRGALAFELPRGLKGGVEIHGFRVGSGGAFYRSSLLLHVAGKQQLQVQVKLDKKTYRPGKEAKLGFQVTDAKGKPVQAALSLSAVDEAVFALRSMDPQLTGLYFQLQKQLLQPRAQLRAISTAPLSRVVRPSARVGGMEELRAVMFATAGSQFAPSRVQGVPFHSRKYKHRSNQRRARTQLVASGVVVLFALVLLWVLGHFVAAGRRELPHLRLKESWNATSLLATWILGLYLPVVLGFVATGLFRHRTRGLAFLGVYVLLCLGFAAALRFMGPKLLEQIETLHGEPPTLARRLHWSYLSLASLPLCLLLVAWAWGRGSRTRVAETAFSTTLGLIVVAALVATGLLALYLKLLQSPPHERSWGLGRLAWLLLSRTAGAGLPGAGVLLLLFFALGATRDLGALRQPMDIVVAKGSPPASRSALPSLPGMKAPERLRQYFPETLLWRPELITDAKGQAQLTMPLADSITTWRLSAQAVSAAGAMGGTTRGLRVFQPFFVDIQAPVKLTQKDQVELPVAIFNYLKTPQRIRLQLGPCSWCKILGNETQSLQLQPGQVTRTRFKIEATRPGRHPLILQAFGSKMADAVQRKIWVVPDGRKVIQVRNGIAQAGATVKHEIAVPKDAIPGSLDLHLKLYPGLLSQVVEGLDNIFRMPHGCFEQTSSTTYPNLMVLRYLREAKRTSAAVEMKALRYLRLGYQRLVSFEVSGGGFSLYGRAPAREALTAYGLMEFADMARVTHVDPALLRRTRRWLEGRQRADGSWRIARYRRASRAITTAYVAWALAQAGGKGKKLQRALAFVSEQLPAAQAGQFPYTAALLSHAYLSAGEPKRAEALLAALARHPKRSKGFVFWLPHPKESGVMYSYGRSLAIETTALVTSALLRARSSMHLAGRSLRWLQAQRDSRGTWYSTQATIQVLRAMIESLRASKGLKSKAQVEVLAHGKVMKRWVLRPGFDDVLRLLDLRSVARVGNNPIALRVRGPKGHRVAYQVVASHYMRRVGPASRPRSRPSRRPLEIALRYHRTELRQKSVLRVDVTVRYNRPGSATLPLLDLGIPPGFDVKREDFAKLLRAKKIDRFRIAGRQIILYVPKIDGGAPLVFSYRLVPRHAMRVMAPVSRAYLYYQPEIKAATTPVLLTVR